MKAPLNKISRFLVYGFEACAIVFIAGLFLWCLLMFRLAQSPMRVDFLVKPIERVLNQNATGYKISFDEAWLGWGGYFEPFRIELKKIAIRNPNGSGVLKVDDIGVGLSKTGLAQFRIQPKEVIIQGLTFRLLRDEDDRFGLDMGENIFTLDAFGPPLPPRLLKAHRHEMIVAVLSQLKGRVSADAAGPGDLSRLRRVIIQGATVGYEDQRLGVRWVGRDTDFVLTRADNGVNLTSDMTVVGGEGRRMAFRANGFYDWTSGATRMVLAFNGLNLKDIAEGSDFLQPLSGINLSWRGSMAVEIDKDFRVDQTRFILAGGAGVLNFDLNGRRFFDQDLPVQGVYAEGETKSDTVDGKNLTRFTFKNITANMGAVTMQAGAQGSVDYERTVNFNLSASLLNMPMDELDKYWPQPLTPLPREWVTGHLSGGTAHKATLDLDMVYSPFAEKKVIVKKLDGTIAFDGIKVDYFAPLAPVENVSGTARYNIDSFHLDLNGGMLEDLKVGKTKIDITDLDKITETTHPMIKIVSKVSGSLLTALKIVDSKPLEYPKLMGIDLNQKGKISGKADIDVMMSFPIHHKLSVSEVKVEADAKLSDIVFKDVVKGIDLTGGPLDLNVSNSKINVKGAALAGGQPIKFDWKKNFSPGAAELMSLTAEMPVTAAMLKSFGAPDDLTLAGSIMAKLNYTQTSPQAARLAVDSDIAGLSFDLDALDFQKSAGAPGSLKATLVLDNGQIKAVEGLRIAVGDQSVAGSASFAGNAWKSLNFNKVLFGGSDFSLTGVNNGASGYDVTLKGARLDVSRLFKDQRPAAQQPAANAAPTAPLKVNFDIARLTTGDMFDLTGVRGRLQRNTLRRIDRLDLDATAGGKPVTLRFGPSGPGYALKFEAQNAGQALAVLGMAKSVRGGHLIVNAVPLPGGGPRDMTGTAVLGKFSLKNTPVIANLLNALSVPGLLSLLNGDGLVFDKARVKFTWTDRDIAQGQEPKRLLGLKNGQTSGSSLGLTFEGTIDKWHDVYNLDGTIVPVSDFSKLISKVPLIGDLLTAGGEGFIAATYKIKGPMDKPSVSVNPLSVLAPGVLRKIFFEN